MNSEEMVNKTGNVVISDEVISIISAIAAKSVEGVSGMQATVAGGIVEFLGKKNPGKGVKVTVNENDVEIEISISIIYGAKIQDVAAEIQDKVKNEVEAMTGYNVKAVNVSVDGLTLPKEEKAPESEETDK